MEVVELDKSILDDLKKKVDEMHNYIIKKPLVQDSLELLTVIELADALNISESTVYRALTRGAITKDIEGKISPICVNDALRKKRLKCEARFAEEFRKTYIYR